MIPSPSHIRGLRKQLLSDLEHVANRRARFMAMAAMVKRPNLPKKLRADVFVRCSRLLRDAAVYGKTLSSSLTIGSILIPIEKLHCDGNIENIVEIEQHILLISEKRVTHRYYTAGKISQHAIDRCYERLATTQTDKVVGELFSALDFLALVEGSLPLSRVKTLPPQLIVPTSRGAFLCRTSGKEIHMRTYVFEPEGKKDISRIAVKMALEEFKSYGGSVPLLDLLMSKPENWWWDTRA